MIKHGEDKMKKLLAILLAFVLLIPMGTVTHAEEAETKPFQFVNMSYVQDGLPSSYKMAFFWTVPLQEGKTATVSYREADVTDPVEIAEALKEDFNSRPDGTRYINFCLPHDAFHTFVEDVIYIEKGVPVVQEWLEIFLKEYSAIGGKLDGLAVDVEYFDLYSSYIHGNYYTKDPLVYDKIVKNPSYQTKIRPMLEERGFKFYPNLTEYTPEIYSIHPSAGDEYAQSRKIWDAVMECYLSQCITDACEALWEYYPDAVVTDYKTHSTNAWLKELDDYGSAIGTGGNVTVAGIVSNHNTYSVRPGRPFYVDQSTSGPLYKTFPGFNNAVYEETPFSMFLYDANLFKNVYLAAEDGRWTAYIAPYTYNLKNEKSVSGTPYYTETVLHIGMLDPEAILGYFMPGDAVVDGEDYYEQTVLVADEIMQELTRVVGYADRKPLAVQTDWNYDFVLSGMYAGGKNYWRLTPDTSKVSVADFKVEGTDPTFSYGGETITFPQGKIIETGEVSVIGTCGYWIETPADVTPVVTRVENYFREYPAFAETFESYESGTEYNYTNALPATCWEVKKQAGGSGTVVADGDGKALAVKGTYTAKNVNMPENITAGDTYAENQAWEVSFTLPADMAADAELVLLNAANEKKKSNDGGFKIAGGKVYYSQDTEYVEMAGVTLTAGTKYTLIREMNFSDAENFTSDYYVYGADGTLLGSAKDIPIEELVLPVYSISLGCTKVAGEAVLLDDYKLYPTKVATDFELYDAKTGMQVKELDKAREGNTAYRLSWLNATEKEKTYSVVAAYYNGETLAEEKVIQEVKMAPNADGVVTGIVENKTEGQTVKVYLRDDNPAENEDAPDINTGDDNDSNGMLIIIIAVAAAVVVIAVVVIVVVVSSKKKKKATAEAAEESPETDAE